MNVNNFPLPHLIPITALNNGLKLICYFNITYDAIVYFITSAETGVTFSPALVCLFVYPSVSLCVCLQNNSKSYGRILMKLSGKVRNGQTRNLIHFGDLYHWV